MNLIDLFDEYSEQELRNIDVKLLGLTSTPFNFSRGSKTYREYLYPNGDVAARVAYVTPYEIGGRSILQPTRTLEFYDTTGTLKLEFDITKELNSKQLRNINREIRQGRWDYLDSALNSLPGLSAYVPEPYKTDFIRAVDAGVVLHKFYEKQIESYIKDGTLDLETAIKGETNVIILELLSLNVRPPDILFIGGLTIKQTLIHQLTGEYLP